MEPSYQRLFKNWLPKETAPKDGRLFLGRLTGTNRAMVVGWVEDRQSFMNTSEGSVDICQWISFTDFADIRSCVWRNYDVV